jgi:hypothetical protein
MRGVSDEELRAMETRALASAPLAEPATAGPWEVRHV